MRARAWLITGATVFLASSMAGCDGDDSTFAWHLARERIEVEAGTRAVFDIVIDEKRNIDSQVGLRVEGSVVGGTVALDPALLPDTESTGQLVVQTTADTPLRVFSLTVFAWEVGHEDTDTGSREAALVVTRHGGSPDFALSVDPTRITIKGNKEPNVIRYYLSALNGFEGTVELELAGLSDDLGLLAGLDPPSLTIDPSRLGSNGIFQLVLSPTPPVESPVILTLTARSGDIVHAVTIQVDIEMAAAPSGGS